MQLKEGHVEILNRAIDAYSDADGGDQDNRGRGIEQAFFEVILKKPSVKKEDWSADMDFTDPWLFPLDVWAGKSDWGLRTWAFQRCQGERGEVTDWNFLFKNYETKGYYRTKEIIHRNIEK